MSHLGPSGPSLMTLVNHFEKYANPGHTYNVKDRSKQPFRECVADLGENLRKLDEGQKRLEERMKKREEEELNKSPIVTLTKEDIDRFNEKITRILQEYYKNIGKIKFCKKINS